MRPATAIVLAVLVGLIFLAAIIQFFVQAR